MLLYLFYFFCIQFILILLNPQWKGFSSSKSHTHTHMLKLCTQIIHRCSFIFCFAFCTEMESKCSDTFSFNVFFFHLLLHILLSTLPDLIRLLIRQLHQHFSTMFFFLFHSLPSFNFSKKLFHSHWNISHPWAIQPLNIESNPWLLPMPANATLTDTVNRIEEKNISRLLPTPNATVVNAIAIKNRLMRYTNEKKKRNIKMHYGWILFFQQFSQFFSHTHTLNGKMEFDFVASVFFVCYCYYCYYFYAKMNILCMQVRWLINVIRIFGQIFLHIQLGTTKVAHRFCIRLL